ncbi:hypothetical protein F4820DRAFT_450012 [Hypoxylon rubiginosum]|uniref:Uncharacterized protein n=1 Tax=Hypoxylon rubiginosum TaxID=110542 RepID=A0ACB9YVH4_9PEZI|nr:hypothetical protein F4820DRAFT_450012 [Hypoxylon rubiginosum]
MSRIKAMMICITFVVATQYPEPDGTQGPVPDPLASMIAFILAGSVLVIGIAAAYLFYSNRLGRRASRTKKTVDGWLVKSARE